MKHFIHELHTLHVNLAAVNGTSFLILDCSKLKSSLEILSSIVKLLKSFGLPHIGFLTKWFLYKKIMYS